jgi:hypothetical protein
LKRAKNAQTTLKQWWGIKKNWFSQEMHIGPSKWQSPLLLGLPQALNKLLHL